MKNSDADLFVESLISRGLSEGELLKVRDLFNDAYLAVNSLDLFFIKDDDMCKEFFWNEDSKFRVSLQERGSFYLRVLNRLNEVCRNDC